MSRIGRNGRGILCSLLYGTTHDNTRKHKSNALLSCVTLLVHAVVLTYESQQGVSEIPPPRGLTVVVIAMVTAQRYLVLRQDVPFSFSFHDMWNGRSLCLLAA